MNLELSTMAIPRSTVQIAFYLLASSVSASASTKYVLFARPPGSSFNQNDPSTLNAAWLAAPNVGIGTNRSARGSLRVGSEIIFSLLQSDDTTLLASLHAALNASETTGVPVSVVLDGENWWSARPDLWNWFDPTRAGYNMANAHNVEWTAPGNASSAVKIGWRNWGSQIRVPPQMNVLAPAVQAAVRPKLAAMAAAVAQWRAALPPERQHLLASVKIGWEAGVQYNAFYYPGGNELLSQPASRDPKTGQNFSAGVSAGVQQLGFAAAHIAGVGPVAGATGSTVALDREQIAAITRQYIAWLSSIVVGAGVPPALVVNHVGGQVPPYGRTVPFAAAFDSNSTPGWSFYWGLPGDALRTEMQAAGRTRWAAAEWNLRSKDEATWREAFNGTLSFLDCAHVAVYNWDGDFEKSKEGQAALRDLLATWDT